MVKRVGSLSAALSKYKEMNASVRVGVLENATYPDGTPVVALYIDSKFIALSGAVAILSCLFASLIPARKSSALNPIDIIRNN